MPYARDKNCWIPLYIFIGAYVIYQFKWRSIIIIASAGITILLTDQIASSIIKPAVQRLRPCNDPAMLYQVHLLVNCGSGFSFVSSHASNHFGIAVFLIFLLGKKFPWIAPVILLWAALICFAQVYVGLHYPLDVLVGGLIGILIGIITGRFCRTALKKSGIKIV